MTTQETQVKDTKMANGTVAKPPVAPSETAGAAAPAGAPVPTEEKEKRASRKVYVVEGGVRAFKSAVEAEKYLNTDPAAPRDFTVIKGLAVEQKQRVSLR